MKTSKKGIDLIKSFEGCRLTAYKCPAGVWTIGYGHTEGVKEGQSITQEKADLYLALDLEKYEGYVEATNLQLNQNQFDALVSFAYNCGYGNLKSLVKNRTLTQIAEAMLLYNKANGTVLSGLVRRRQAEHDLFVSEMNSDQEETKETYVGDNPYPVPTYTLYRRRMGMREDYVKWLQWEAKDLGFPMDNHGGIDGQFGDYTEKVVGAIQVLLDLEDDKKCGPKTIAALVARHQ